LSVVRVCCLLLTVTVGKSLLEVTTSYQPGTGTHRK
jgi:hypothetical protein